MHFVDSDVFATLVREQRTSARCDERMSRFAEAAEAEGANIIFSACSMNRLADSLAKSARLRLSSSPRMGVHHAADRVGVL